MARPIKATPTLKDNDAKNFDKRVEKHLTKKLQVKTLPCLDKAKEIVFSCDFNCQN
ncbi:hypothetical protein [Desulfovibrio sp. JC010]|uniref:hypothetical protein n=1 Tax=Desulfovibrio sp. JC010 TaxID=2593641 RepID=UPI0013D47A40|nr:hypothetical protein [Desulfovibrio sp. JC010]